jgi:hypothetical protein
MIEYPVLERFEKLSRDAPKNITFGCQNRAEEMAGFIRQYDTRYPVEIFRVTPHNNKGTIKPRKLKTEWYGHYIVIWNDTVLDPSYGEPVHADEYLKLSFRRRGLLFRLPKIEPAQL